MTDQEINTAIAEACGWYRLEPLQIEPPSEEFIWAPNGWVRGRDVYGKLACGSKELPDYANDLNAMHEAEETLPITNYYEQLYVADKTGIMVGYRHLWHATARQRAEAFLRVKGLWKD